MRPLVIASLALNLVVLIPVCSGIVTDAAWARSAYGSATPARGILLSVYIAIAVISALLLWSQDPKLVAALLAVQIIYKLTTPATVGSLQNPVVVGNLLIAAFHSVTLLSIWRELR